jgi:hypothetical protein
MPQPLQNRKCQRAENELPVLYKYKGADKFFSGIMRNYSEAGICFETGHPVKPGAEIFIIIENVIRDSDILDNGEANYAVVEWCQATASCNTRFYKAGAKLNTPPKSGMQLPKKKSL